MSGLIHKLKKGCDLLRNKKYKVLLFEVHQYIPRNIFRYNHFYFVRCEKFSGLKSIRPLNDKYNLSVHDLSYDLLERIKVELPYNMDTVYYRVRNREEKTKVITIVLAEKIIGVQFVLFDTQVPSPSGYDLHMERPVVTCHGMYVHPDYRNKGLHIHTLVTSFDLSRQFGTPGLFSEIHFLNRNSILSHKRIGFDVYKNVHYIQILGKKVFFEGKKKFQVQ